MKIILNGEPRSVEPTTISALVRELNLIPATLLIEHNGLALHREESNSSALLRAVEFAKGKMPAPLLCGLGFLRKKFACAIPGPAFRLAAKRRSEFPRK
jgi:sulfur carrier protein ThiS